MRSIAEAATRRGDNFSWLRHVAALMVLWAHSYTYLGPAHVEPLARVLAGFDSGRLAVYLFFAVSGFLITTSLMRNDAVLRYAWHRLLRVYPAYLACLLATVFAIGIACTSLPVRDYLAHADTWNFLRVNAVPLAMQQGLPGVFMANPLPGLVNGPIWSLGAEVRWYAAFGVLALLGAFRHRLLFTAVALALIADSLWRKGERLPLSAWILAALWTLTALCAATRFGGSLCVIASVYLALYVAYALPRLPPLRVDYSYGLFLYGGLMQQVLVSLWPQQSSLLLFIASVALVLPFAMLSWHLIERPALAQKHRLDRARAARSEVPVAAPATATTGLSER